MTPPPSPHVPKSNIGFASEMMLEVCGGIFQYSPHTKSRTVCSPSKGFHFSCLTCIVPAGFTYFVQNTIFFVIVYCRILFIVEVQVPRIVKVSSTIGHQNYDSGWPAPSFVLPQSVGFVRYHCWVRGRCDMCAKRYFSDNGNDAVLSSPPLPMVCCGCRTCW
jgi:hypothetical protein